MTNAVDCSNLFPEVDAADVVITESTGHWAARGDYVVFNTKLEQTVWCGSYESCERAMASYIEFGI